MNHAYALVTVCPKDVNPTSEDIKLYIIIKKMCAGGAVFSED